MQDELLTVSEVAEILRVSDKTIRRYLHQGLLDGFRLGSPEAPSEWRIPRRSLDRIGGGKKSRRQV